MLEKQNRVLGYQNSPVILEGGQSNQTSDAVPDIDDLQEGVNDDNDLNFDSAIDRESALLVGVKRRLLDLHDECWVKKRVVPTNVTER